MTSRNQGLDHTSGFEPERAEELLRLAARLQQEAKSKLSVGELNGIAQEAGIEPRFVEMALAAQSGRMQSQSLQSLVRLRLELLVFPVVGLLLCHLIVNSRAWAENLFTTIAPRGLLGLVLMLGIFCAYQAGKLLPKTALSLERGVAALILLPFLFRLHMPKKYFVR